MNPMTASENKQKNWYQLESAKAFERLSSNPKTGLDGSSVSNRLQEHGTNELLDQAKDSVAKVFARQFKNPLLIILMVGSALSWYGGHPVDAIAILVLVFVNATISSVQEIKASQSLEALKQMGAPETLALRDGEWSRIPAKQVVPGDVLKLNTGDIVAADMRLFQSNSLQVDEAALTGESEPVEKQVEAIEEEDVGIGDRTNMAFMGSIVTGGNGQGVACATGMASEVGHIAKLMRATDAGKTPMQRRLDTLSHILIGAAIAAVALVVGIGIYNGADWMEMVQTGISLSVAAIPEGLPTIVTIVMTMGARRMAEQKALVRNLSSVETLGSTTVICSDKTGTLTLNQMQVVRFWSGGKTWEVTGKGFDPKGEFVDENGKATTVEESTNLEYALNISALCNDAVLKKSEGKFNIEGNPTEGALVVAAEKAGVSKQSLIDQGTKILRTFPFDSKRKMASVVAQGPKGRIFVIAKGAPDVIARQSEFIYWNEESLEFNKNHNDNLNDAIIDFGTRALRTLAVAAKEINEDQVHDSMENLENGLTVIAIHGIIDPPRPEVLKSVAECRSAGIRTVMITGDHAATATAIAEEIGIKYDDSQRVVTGPELENTSDEELQSIVDDVAVFARVSPEHKQRIVRALQANGEIAAMTGDGVNDAPALKNADIGVAMGRAGTEVAKDAADLVLLDDNFSSIVGAVKEGRRIYDNIRKFLREALTANVAEVSAVLFAFLLMGDDPIVPLTALMILWINLVSDALPSLALGLEPAESDLMTRKLPDRSKGFFGDNLGTRIIVRGLVHGWVTYLLFDFALRRGFSIEYAQTIAFLALVVVQTVHIFDARTFTSIYRRNPFENKYLLWASLIGVGLTLITIYTPPGNFILGTTPLQFKHLLMASMIAALPTFVLSGVKEIFQIKWL